MDGVGVSLGCAVMLAAAAVPPAYLFPIIAVIFASFAGYPLVCVSASAVIAKSLVSSNADSVGVFVAGTGDAVQAVMIKGKI